MSNNIRYGSRILDMGVLLEMKALVNANGGVSRCIMECRQLACEVRQSQQLPAWLSCVDDWLCRFSSVMYHRFDKEQIQWRADVDRDEPREKVYIFSPDNVSFHKNDIKDSSNNSSGITVSITASKICAGQKEFDAFLKLAEKLRENPTGN
ncbi:hypothetical protein O3W21_13475 [Staphylococcus aureus]|nr:hypothetical protein [Staphylococcus aureus]